MKAMTSQLENKVALEISPLQATRDERGRFVKGSHIGYTPWNKGKRLSEETRRKMSQTRRGVFRSRVLKHCKHCGKEFSVMKSRVARIIFCSKECQAIYKRQHPEEYSLFKKGHKGYGAKPWLGKHLSEEARRRQSESLKRFYREHPEIRKEFGKNHSGENHWNWKGGRTTEIRLLRQSEQYKEWRDAVYRRDNWTCQNPECGYKGNKIVAHHIKDFEEYPELRYDMDNGQTLCRACHLKLHYDIGEGRQFKAGQYPWNKLPVPAREELEQLYWGWGLSTVDIARVFETSHRTVRKWLRHYSIPIRSLSEAHRKLFNNQHYLPLWERETKDESRILEKVQAKQGA